MAVTETDPRQIEVTSELDLDIHKIVDGIDRLDNYIEGFRQESGSIDNYDPILRQARIRKNGLLLLAAMLQPYYPEHITVTVIGDRKEDIHPASQNIVEVQFSTYLTGLNKRREYSGFLDLMAENIDGGDSTTVMQFLGEHRFVSDSPNGSSKRLYNEIVTVVRKLESETDPDKHAILLALRDKLLMRVVEQGIKDPNTYGVRRIPLLNSDGEPTGEGYLRFRISNKFYHILSTADWEEQIELRGGFD